MTNAFWLTTDDHCDIYVRHWDTNRTNKKGIIFISHGMTEHIGRYDHVAAYFNEQGYLVYGDDHRGHGKTGEKQGQLGYIADKDGFQLVVKDLHFLIRYIKERHPNLPIFIFGHSMGSFITRNYLQNYSDEVAGVILAGSGSFPEKTSKAGLQLASLQDPKKESTLMNNLVFGNYNNKIVEKLTSFDWLTRDKQVVDQYLADPFSGYVPTAGFFVDLLTGILSMQDERKNSQIRKDLPMMFISGDADPVGNYSKGVFHAATRYTNIGMDQVLVTLFPEARHELHNEINKADVFDCLNKWLDKQVDEFSRR